MAADGKTPPTHPQGGGGNIMCTCSIFVCRHKNNDMSTLLGHVHTYIPTDRQTDTQAYIHKSIQTYSYTYTWLHMCDVSPLWGGGWGGTRGGWIIYIYINTSSSKEISFWNLLYQCCMVGLCLFLPSTETWKIGILRSIPRHCWRGQLLCGTWKCDELQMLRLNLFKHPKCALKMYKNTCIYIIYYRYILIYIIYNSLINHIHITCGQCTEGPTCCRLLEG